MSILNQIFNEDCMETMKRIPNGAVDLMLTDPPYNITACEWDKPIDLTELWEQWNRIVKPNGAMIFTASQPFTSELVMSNRSNFKYEYIWVKTKASNFQLARKMPMKRHENILVFYREYPTFNLELSKLQTPIKSSRNRKGSALQHCQDNGNYYQDETGFLFSDIYFPNPSGDGHLHPTMKPLEMFRFLIELYTNEGEMVYDGYMGSGTTAHASILSKRNFVGAELNNEYFELATERIKNETAQLKIF